MKHLVVRFKSYSWSRGSLYIAECPGHGEIEICCPVFSPAYWCIDGKKYRLQSGSNTSGQLYVVELGKTGEIHESSFHWDISFESCSYKLFKFKRAAILQNAEGFIATIKMNPIGRIVCSYSEKKGAPLALLLFVTVYYRLSLGRGGG